MTYAVEFKFDPDPVTVTTSIPKAIPAATSSQLMNVYVAASAPAGTKTPLCKPQTVQKSNSWWTLVEKTPWTPMTAWPIAAFKSNVPVGTIVLVELMTNCVLIGQAGTEWYVGYGFSADEMLSAGRLQKVYKVPDLTQ